MNIIPFGSLVRDKVTGFRGITIYYIEHMNDCVRYAVQPVIDKEGQLPDIKILDGPNLEIIALLDGDLSSAVKTPNTFELGVKVKDRLTGLTGIAVLRVKNRHSSDQYGIQPPMNKKCEIPDLKTFDEEDLEQIDPPPPKGKKKEIKPPGGPHDCNNAIVR